MASASAADVTVANNPTVGQLLIGPNGHTLYLFEQDNGTMSACTTGCAPTWPALAASGAPKRGPGVDGSKLSTANGQVAHQVVYNGHLLYFFAGDSAPGQTNGVKIPGWAAVSPSGNKIDKS